MSFVDTTTLKNSTIMLLYSEKDEIKLDPPYQRMGGIWTKEKRRLLIDSILNDYDIPKIYFHAYDIERQKRTGFRYAVIDGRQRLETIWRFIDGEFTLDDEFEYQRDPKIDLTGLSYEDIAKLHPKIRIKFDSFVLPVVLVSIDGNDLDLIEDMFSRLNEAVPLNAAEKRNALGGNMVATITTVSGHRFFKDYVRFSNTRYQHKEIAARLLLTEESLQTTGKIIDTKKAYLDDLAKRYREKNKPKMMKISASVKAVLDAMCKTFSQKDDLLLAQGTIVVYYLLFRLAAQHGELARITRRKLIDFRVKLTANRALAEKNYAKSSFELLEYDRLNQQGTNDASSIKERYRILAEELRLTKSEL